MFGKRKRQLAQALELFSQSQKALQQTTSNWEQTNCFVAGVKRSNESRTCDGRAEPCFVRKSIKGLWASDKDGLSGSNK